MHACDRQTDRRTDRITTPKTALAYARAVKIGSAVRPVHTIEKNKKTGQDKTAISVIFHLQLWRETSWINLHQKFCFGIIVPVQSRVQCLELKPSGVTILQGGRIFDFAVDFCMGLYALPVITTLISPVMSSAQWRKYAWNSGGTKERIPKAWRRAGVGCRTGHPRHRVQA